MNLMFDSITVSAIPHGAQATAGYVNGRWPNSASMQAAFPSLPHVSIAISADVDADCLDVEPGDATIAQAPGWVDRQHARGVALPIVYTSASNVTALRAALGSRQYLLWAAHYDYNPHVCGSCGYPGADATQFADRGPNGENVDQTLMSDRFFAAISGTATPTVAPAPTPPKEIDDMAWKLITTRNNTGANLWPTVLTEDGPIGLQSDAEVAAVLRYITERTGTPSAAGQTVYGALTVDEETTITTILARQQGNASPTQIAGAVLASVKAGGLDQLTSLVNALPAATVTALRNALNASATSTPKA